MLRQYLMIQSSERNQLIIGNLYSRIATFSDEFDLFLISALPKRERVTQILTEGSKR